LREMVNAPYVQYEILEVVVRVGPALAVHARHCDGRDTYVKDHKKATTEITDDRCKCAAKNGRRRLVKMGSELLIRIASPYHFKTLRWWPYPP
jgi:hypothetical protein